MSKDTKTEMILTMTWDDGDWAEGVAERIVDELLEKFEIGVTATPDTIVVEKLTYSGPERKQVAYVKPVDRHHGD